MSDDKGKELEMDAIILVASMGKKHPKVDLLRHTTTNTADNGLDITMVSTKQHLDEFLEVANGSRTEFSDPKNDRSKKVQVRLDAKYRSEKITKPEAEKFVGDIAKNPTMDAHILFGSNLTEGASKVIQNAQNNNPKKIVAHIDSDGVKNLKNAIYSIFLNDKKKDDE